MTLPRVRLGELLVDARVITREQLDEVLAAQARDPRRIGTLLVESGLVSETAVTQILSQQLSVPWVSLQHIEFSHQLLDLVPREIADRHCLVPIFVRRVRGVGQTVYVAMDDPTNEEALGEVSAAAALPVRAMIAPPSHIRAAITSYYGAPSPGTAEAPPPVAPPPEPESVGPSPTPTAQERVNDALASVNDVAFAPESSPLVSQVQTVDPMLPPRSEPPAVQVDSAIGTSVPVTAQPEARPANGTAAPVTRRSRALGGQAARSSDSPESAPELETHEIAIPRPRPAGRMVTLTLLDGTQVNVPVRKRGATPFNGAPEPNGTNDAQSSQDLVAVVRAVAQGADVSKAVGPDVQWEELFALLLRVLVKKNLISEAELVAELDKH